MTGTIPEQAEVLLAHKPGCGQLSAHTEGPWWGPSPRPCPAELLAQPAGSSPQGAFTAGGDHPSQETHLHCREQGNAKQIPEHALVDSSHREQLSCTSLSATAELGMDYTICNCASAGDLLKQQIVKAKAETTQHFQGWWNISCSLEELLCHLA